MIRIAIIGTGGMANSHARNFGDIRGCAVTACCDIVPGRAAEYAQRHGIPAAYESTREMLEKEELDAVSIVTPDRFHCEPALMAIDRGLAVMCEKPLSDNLADAKKMTQAAKRKGVITTVNFSYRNRAATQKAARLVATNKIGRVMHVSGRYLQSWLSAQYAGDWRKKPQWLWRLSTNHGSMGCLGDIGVHLYDLANFVVGDIEALHCEMKCFDKGTKKIDEYVLDANDGFVSSVRFAGGAIGTLHSSRWATGHKNTVAIRVHGDKGALDLDLDRPDEEALRACIGRRAVDAVEWKPVHCPKTPNNQERFIAAIKKGEQPQNTFEDGLRAQACLEASMRSFESDRFVKLG